MGKPKKREYIKYEPGDKIGKFIFISEAGFKHGSRIVRIRCFCGNTFDCHLSHIKFGHTKSCGCLPNGRKTNPKALRREPLYSTWYGIKDRCLNKDAINYSNYGGRGIKICERWKKSFSNFASDMGNRPSNQHTVERIDNNKGYNPQNCAWRTRHDQNRNKRNTILVTYNGQTKCVADWCKIYNIGQQTLSYRVRNGWEIEKALTTPGRPK